MAWWLLIAVAPSAIAALVQCGKSRETTHGTAADKSNRSKKGGKPGDRSAKSKSQSARSSRQNKVGNSGKSKRSAKGSSSAKEGVKGKSSKSKKAVPVGEVKSKSLSKSAEELSSKSSKKKNKSSKSGKSKSSKSGKSKKKTSAAAAALKADLKATKVATQQVATMDAAAPVPLRAEPVEVSYKAAGGMQHVNVVNESTEKRVFKVKCSDNHLYRVNPVYGMVDAGKTARVDVLRQNGSAKVDKLVIVTGRAGEVVDPKDAFLAANAAEHQMMVVPLLAEA